MIHDLFLDLEPELLILNEIFSDKIYNNLELDIMNKKNELLKLIEVSDKLEEKKIE